MSESRMIHEFPARCSCLALTSKQGRSYWFRTCDLHTSVWEAGAHVVPFPARQSIQPVSYTHLDVYKRQGNMWAYMPTTE